MFPLQDNNNPLRFPFWVFIIIIINIVMFYLELSADNPDDFIETFALIPQAINLTKLETLYPFFTSQFLHGGFLHILSNLWFLWIFGDNVEDRLGVVFFPVFYLTAGAIGNFLQYLFIPHLDIPLLGASGAVAGVLGIYFALFPRNKVKTLIFIIFFVTIIEIPTAFMLFYWFFIQLISGAASVAPSASQAGGIAYFAHIGGFGLGWILGKMLAIRSSPVAKR